MQQSHVFLVFPTVDKNHCIQRKIKIIYILSSRSHSHMFIAYILFLCLHTVIPIIIIHITALAWPGPTQLQHQWICVFDVLVHSSIRFNLLIFLTHSLSFPCRPHNTTLTISTPLLLCFKKIMFFCCNYRCCHDRISRYIYD